MLTQTSLFTMLCPVYGIGDALSDVTSSALLAHACANVVLHSYKAANGGKSEHVKTPSATESIKEFQAVILKLADAPRLFRQTLDASGV
jgi:uncharacterized membrane protein